MIGEVGSGSSFRGLHHYLLHGRSNAPKEPAWVELRNLYASRPEDAQLEMRATAAQNPRVEQPVLHLMVSPAPDDQLTREQWTALADRVLRELGLEEHEAMVVLHTDTATPHLHVAVNRVHPSTYRAWATWKSKTRLEGILRRVERAWGLHRVQGRLAGPDRQIRDRHLPPALSAGEHAQLRHRAEEPQLLRWRRSVGGHFEEARSWTDLAARLKANGLELAARGRGLVVTDGERYAKASRIDRAYSRAKLEARFGESLAEWRRNLDHFRAAAALHPRHLANQPGGARARATARTLRATGRRLGWSAISRMEGPLAPAVASFALASRLRHSAPPPSSAEWHAYVREHLRPALLRSRSWAEAEGRLRLYGAWVAPSADRTAELVVTDGEHASALSRLGPQFESARLAERLGPWDAWERSRRALYQAVGRYQGALRAAPERAERWARLARIIALAERRIERRDHLRETFRAAERTLRKQLEPSLRGHEPLERQLILRRIRSAATRAQLERELSAAHRSTLLSRLRSASPPAALRRAGLRYWNLAREIRDANTLARSAARRLRVLRRRARLLAPANTQARAASTLVAVARPLLGLGVRSLVAQAAPGVGPALRLVRLLHRGAKELARER